MPARPYKAVSLGGLSILPVAKVRAGSRKVKVQSNQKGVGQQVRLLPVNEVFDSKTAL